MRRGSFAFVFLSIFLVLIFATVVFAGSSYFDKVKKTGKLVIGLNASYPPFAFWSDDGVLGFDVELAMGLARALGLDPAKDIKFVPVKPGEAADALVSGKIDIAVAALSLSPQRLSKVAFSTPYVTVTKAALLQRAKIPRVIIGDKLQIMPVSSYNDLFKLQPLSIGVKEKTTTLGMAKRDFSGSKVVGYPDADALGKAFLEGKIDVVIHEDPFVRFFTAANKSKSRGFVALTKPVSKQGLCIAYRYGDADFGRFIDNYISYLLEQGIIEKWKSKYFDKASWAGGGK